MSGVHLIEVLNANEEVLFEAVLAEVYSEAIRQKNTFQSVAKKHLHSRWVAFCAGRPAGRLAIYFNPDLTYEGASVLCFGSYECVDDAEISAALLHKVEAIARETESAYILGPMSGSTWQHYRFSLQNNQPSFLMEPYNHAYYNAHVQVAGFQPVAHYLSAVDNQIAYNEDELKSLEEKFTNLGVRLRTFNRENIEAELVNIGSFCIEAFRGNRFYTSISPQEFAAQYLPYAAAFETELILLAEDDKGELHALFFALPDHTHPENETIIVKTIARRKDSPFRGISAYLSHVLYKKALKLGYTRAIHAFMLRENPSVNVSAKFSSGVYREYALYLKKVP